MIASLAQEVLWIRLLLSVDPYVKSAKGSKGKSNKESRAHQCLTFPLGFWPSSSVSLCFFYKWLQWFLKIFYSIYIVHFSCRLVSSQLYPAVFVINSSFCTLISIDMFVYAWLCIHTQITYICIISKWHTYIHVYTNYMYM